MHSLDFAASGFELWPLFVAASLVLLAIWIGRHLRLRKVESEQLAAALNRGGSVQASGLVYTNAPTIRVRDSQRIDRLHRVVSLKAGEHADLLDLTFDRLPRLRVTLRGVQSALQAAPDYARLHVELGGAIVGCGSEVKSVGTNEFLTPRAARDEQPFSILHFDGQGTAVSFLRIKVLRIDVEAGSAEIDVLHICGHWAS